LGLDKSNLPIKEQQVGLPSIINDYTHA